MTVTPASRHVSAGLQATQLRSNLRRPGLLLSGRNSPPVRWREVWRVQAGRRWQNSARGVAVMGVKNIGDHGHSSNVFLGLLSNIIILKIIESSVPASLL